MYPGSNELTLLLKAPYSGSGEESNVSFVKKKQLYSLLGDEKVKNTAMVLGHGGGIASPQEVGVDAPCRYSRVELRDVEEGQSGAEGGEGDDDGE